MKNIILLLSVLFTFCSCSNNNDKKQPLQKMNLDDIRFNEVVHDSLTTNQIDNIKRIHSTFAEVYSISLEETITNFKRDQNPDSEITVWLRMADAYEKYLMSKKSKLDLSTKKEVFRLIFSRSMMPDDEAISNSKLTILTEKEAKEVLRYYTALPDPIEVVKKP